MKPHVVVLGGGNGTSRILTALLPLLQSSEIASLHALVHMADDGGSTGRLREQYEVGAMGDLTRCMLALSQLRGDVRGDEFIKALEYRFVNGDFKGHTLRNALLAAMELTSDLDSAIATFARILQIPKYAGVVPTTLKALTQQVFLKTNGEQQLLGEGQTFISWNVDLQQDPSWGPGAIHVAFAGNDVQLNPRARQVLEDATHIIVAPGHTYGSILPTLASLNVDSSFSPKDVKARTIVVMTLLTTPKHTTGWSGEDFVRSYEAHLGKKIDVVIANTSKVDIELEAGQDWVLFKNSEHPYDLTQDNLVHAEISKAQKGDVVRRAIVVHDTEKLKSILTPLITNQT